MKTFKRDYVRVNPIPDARTVLLRIDHWMEDYNSEHPHSRLGYWATAHRGSTLHHSNQPSVQSNQRHSLFEGASHAGGIIVAQQPRSPRKRCCSMTLIADSGVRARVWAARCCLRAKRQGVGTGAIGTRLATRRT